MNSQCKKDGQNGRITVSGCNVLKVETRDGENVLGYRGISGYIQGWFYLGGVLT